MITWFSAGVPRAWRVTLGLVCLCAATARAEAPAGAGAATVGPKALDPRQLSEARLAAGRAASAAGRAAEATALYGQALAAGLMGLASELRALPDEGLPRPTSVTSLANEEPVEVVVESDAVLAQDAVLPKADLVPEAPSPATVDEPARPAAPAPVVAPVAAAPVVVVAAPAAPPSPAFPPTFAVGVRSALVAKDPTGGEHVSGGLMFSWLTFATTRGRGSVVFDLESTRWQSGRTDMTDRAQVAFYGLGFDWTVPFASRGTGLFLGAEAAAGVLQSSTMTTPVVETDGVLQVMPHVGGAVAYEGVGLFVDAGWRFQLLTASAAGKASEGGPVLQGGLRVEMSPGGPRAPSGFDLGYTARFFSPNGSRVYGRYGGLRGGGSGPMLEHELVVTTGAFLPRHAEQGLALTFLGAGQEGSGTPLTMIGLGWVGTWHAFATRQLFNPYAGLRLGLAYMSSGDASTFKYSKQIDAVASGMAGLDVAVHPRLALRLGVAYDAVAYANDVADTSLSGYAVEAGAIIRL